MQDSQTSAPQQKEPLNHQAPEQVPNASNDATWFPTWSMTIAMLSNPLRKHWLKKRIKNRILEDKYEASQKCIKALREKLKGRDQENEGLLFPAREQRLLETDQCEILKANLSAEAQELFLNEQKQSCTTPAGRRYSDELKTFAVTLHFYSP